MARRVSKEEYEHLCRVIQRWNEHRLELFEITLPNQVRENTAVEYTDLVVRSLLNHSSRPVNDILDRSMCTYTSPPLPSQCCGKGEATELAVNREGGEV